MGFDDHSTSNEWTGEGPIPLIRETPPPAPYPVDALGSLAEAVKAIHDRTQAPEAVCAHSALGVASLAAQGLANVTALHGAAPLSLFLLTVAESGERKTACDRLATEAVEAFEERLAEGHRERYAEFKNRLDAYETARRDILKGAKKDRDGALADLNALGAEPEPPLLPSITSPEPTLEGITRNMNQLRPSLGIYADEGGSFVGGHSMNAENRLRTVAGLSSLWDGSTVKRWRAGDGVTAFRGRRLAMHLMIQPVAAEALLGDPLAQGQGFLARFLIAQPDSAIGTRTREGHSPASDAALARFTFQIGELLDRPLPLKEGTRNELDPPTLGLAPEAEALLRRFAMRVETAQAPGGKLEAVRPFASKAAEHAARIAGVLAIYRTPDARAVSIETMTGAIELADWYLGEAARLGSAAHISETTANAERMRRWLIERWSEDAISASVAADWGPFKETAKARAALQALQKYGWLIEAPGVVVKGKPRKEAWSIVREAE